jgi:hypothetical protein
MSEMENSEYLKYVDDCSSKGERPLTEQQLMKIYGVITE